MRRVTICLLAAMAVAGVFTGCTSFIAEITGASATMAVQSLSVIEANNETVELGAGTFRGPLRIDGNMVRVVGAGIGATVITNGVVISGNGNSLDNLSVEGPVRIDGNNNDLRAADLRSTDVDIDGNGNKL